MSGGWNFDLLDEYVRDSIASQPPRLDDPALAACGCHNRESGWWLCEYHDGMQEGCELIDSAVEERDELIVMLTIAIEYLVPPGGLAIPGIVLTEEHVQLWHEIAEAYPSALKAVEP